jgi:Spy/CpxP family protein refolding chaperone
MAAALVALLAGWASAQRGGGGGGGRGGGMGGGDEMGGRGAQAQRQVDKLEALTKELKLNGEQKTQLEAIFDEVQKQSIPLLQQSRDERQNILNLTLNGKSVDDSVNKLAAYNAQVMSLSVGAFNKALAKLDEKQKSKAPKLFEMVFGMFSGGNWRRSN